MRPSAFFYFCNCQTSELLVKQVEERVTYQCLHILDHCNTLEEAKKKIEALLKD